MQTRQKLRILLDSGRFNFQRFWLADKIEAKLVTVNVQKTQQTSGYKVNSWSDSQFVWIQVLFIRLENPKWARTNDAIQCNAIQKILTVTLSGYRARMQYNTVQ